MRLRRGCGVGLGPACLAILFAAALYPATLYAQGPAHRLRLSDRIGQTSRYRLSFDIQMRAEYTGPGEVDERARQLLDMLASGLGLRTAVEYEQKLVEVGRDGTRTFDVRWHDYQYTGELGGQQITPPAGHVALTRELLSQPARVKTTSSGRTVDVAYSNPRLARIAGAFQQLDGGMPTFLPEGPVRVGDRWTSTAQIPVGLAAGGAGSMILDLEHRFAELRQGPEGAIAVIELSGNYSQLEGLEGAALGTPLHVQASLVGSSLFHIGQGRFVGGAYELDMFALHAADGIEIQVTGHANGGLELVDAR